MYVCVLQPQVVQQQQAALMMAAAQGGGNPGAAAAAGFFNPSLALATPHPALAAMPNGLSTGTITPTTSGEARKCTTLFTLSARACTAL